MPFDKFDRSRIKMRPLSERENKRRIETDHVDPDATPNTLSDSGHTLIDELVARIRGARASGRPVMLAFGAHTIKNGLAPVLIKGIKTGWFTHLATNGAGIIHDWEFAFQGQTSEDVETYVSQGQFGHWEETGFHLNLALNLGSFRGLGYGESIGSLISGEAHQVPEHEELEQVVKGDLDSDPFRSAAAADLLGLLRRFDVPSGNMSVPHPWKSYSVQATAHDHGVPLTGHPMFGHDIIYNHRFNHGASLGRCAERDYLTFADSVCQISGGVYISIGSAIMSPMVFEKSMSMAQNLAIQRGERIQDHFIFVVDLAESNWDWSKGEPPEENPAYYLRYNKTFSRVGGMMRYLTADNRDFLLHLTQRLGSKG